MRKYTRTIFAIVIVTVVFWGTIGSFLFALSIFNMTKIDTCFEGAKEDVFFAYDATTLVLGTGPSVVTGKNVDFHAEITIYNNTDKDQLVTFRAIEIKNYLTSLLKTPIMVAVDDGTGKQAVYNIKAHENVSVALTLRGPHGLEYLKYDRKAPNFLCMAVWNGEKTPEGIIIEGNEGDVT